MAFKFLTGAGAAAVFLAIGATLLDFRAAGFFAGAFLVVALRAIACARLVSIALSSVLTCKTPCYTCRHYRAHWTRPRDRNMFLTVARRFVSSSRQRTQAPLRHDQGCPVDFHSAFQGLGPSTVLLLRVLAHRWQMPRERIDSRSQIPLFIVPTVAVNKKQPLRGKFLEKFWCAAISGGTRKSKTAAACLPRRFSGPPKKSDYPRWSIGTNFRFSGPV